MIAQKLITVGENENTVFRSCKDGIHTNVFETICAFLNTRGGTLLLGVDESGEVYGFKERAIPDIIQALKMATQNADTFQPPFEMEPVREIVDGINTAKKDTVRLHIAKSSCAILENLK